MSVTRKSSGGDSALTLLCAAFALPPEHIALAQSPAVPTKLLLERQASTSRTVGRPYFIWKDDLDLAREVNDRLAAGPPH